MIVIQTPIIQQRGIRVMNTLRVPNDERNGQVLQGRGIQVARQCARQMVEAQATALHSAVRDKLH